MCENGPARQPLPRYRAPERPRCAVRRTLAQAHDEETLHRRSVRSKQRRLYRGLRKARRIRTTCYRLSGKVRIVRIHAAPLKAQRQARLFAIVRVVYGSRPQKQCETHPALPDVHQHDQGDRKTAREECHFRRRFDLPHAAEGRDRAALDLRAQPPVLLQARAPRLPTDVILKPRMVATCRLCA